MAKRTITVTGKVIYEWTVEVDDNMNRNEFQQQQEIYFEALRGAGLEDKHFLDVEVDWI